MTGKDMEHPDHRPAITGGTGEPHNDIKASWVDRGRQFIKEQPAGIDAWPANGAQVPVTTLVNAYITITAVLDSDGRDAGRLVEFYMRPRGLTRYEHMASMLYGPPRERFGLRLKRKHLKTKYHV